MNHTPQVLAMALIYDAFLALGFTEAESLNLLICGRTRAHQGQTIGVTPR